MPLLNGKEAAKPDKRTDEPKMVAEVEAQQRSIAQQQASWQHQRQQEDQENQYWYAEQ